MESAKRRAPSARPVEHEGVRYEQLRRPKEQGFKQSGGVIAAIDEASGEQLWAVQLYETAPGTWIFDFGQNMVYSYQ